MYPENYRYTKEHEWVLVEGDTGTIGITDHGIEPTLDGHQSDGAPLRGLG